MEWGRNLEWMNGRREAAFSCSGENAKHNDETAPVWRNGRRAQATSFGQCPFVRTFAYEPRRV
jgi:hypothetical protein